MRRHDHQFNLGSNRTMSIIALIQTGLLLLILLTIVYFQYSPVERIQPRRMNIEPTPSPYPSIDLRPSMKAVMEESGTDKLDRHAYDRYYEMYFKEFRDKQNLSLLEIGVDSGKSLRLWTEYFSNPAFIHGIAYGVDVTQAKKKVCDWDMHACNKVTIFTGDQSDPLFLKTFADKYQYDIIIDDGSHLPRHQIFSFQYLFSILKPGGVYVLEDLETSYWNTPGASLYGNVISAGVGASPKVNAIEKLKQYIDVLMRFHMAYPSLSISDGDDTLFSLTFGQGLVIIRKSSDENAFHIPNIQKAPVDHSLLKNWMLQAKESNP